METTAINRKAFIRELKADMRRSVKAGVQSVFFPRAAEKTHRKSRVSLGGAVARVGRCMYVAMDKYARTNGVNK